MRASIRRVLAIAPGAQHLGVAVLEGEELIWFGVKSFSGRKTAGTLLPKVERYIDELIARHTPGTLAIEEPYYAQARLSPLLGPLTAALKRSGRQQGLRVVRYLPTTVKARLCEKKRTRQGDIFAIATTRKTRQIRAATQRHLQLFDTTHVATQARLNGAVYIRGTLRHLPEDRSSQHGMLRLGTSWWIAVKNLALGSWNAVGTVD